MKAKTVILFWLTLLLTSCGSSGSMQQRTATPQPAQQTVSSEMQRKYDYFFLEAMRLKNKNEYDAAFGLLKHCLTIQPQAPSALYEISQFYLMLKQTPQGERALEQAVANAPDNYWYSQALASLYQQQNRKQEAIDLLEKMVTHFPGRQEPLLNLVDLYSQTEAYRQVITTLDRLEKRIGKNEQLSMEKFRIYLQMNDNKKAFREIESLIEEYPLEPRYQVILSEVYMQNGRDKEALEYLQRVLATEPDNPLALLTLASYYIKTGEKERYDQQIDTLLLNKKLTADTRLNVMRQYVVQHEQSSRDSTRILSLFDCILEQDKEDGEMRMLYVQYLQAKGMRAESLLILKQVLQLDPTNKAARMLLLGEAIRKEDQQEVIRLCEPGIEATPDALEFYFYLAIAYNEEQRWDDLIRISQQALEVVTPESPKELVSDFYALIADAHYRKKEIDAAFAAFDSALLYNAANMGVLNNYAYYLSVLRRDLDKAEEMSYRTVKAEPNNATYLDTYAWILFEKGNYTEARIYIDHAMKSEEPQSSVVVEHCGDIHFKSGDTEGALKYWKQALEMGSESKTLQQKIEKKKYLSE